MASDLVCPRCGEPLPSGDAECPICADRTKHPFRWWIHHYKPSEPVILAGAIIISAALWTAATFVTKAYAARQRQLAQQWFVSGEADMQAGRLDAAVQELRTALAYSHDNFEYRLRLAEALASNGRTRQAQAYLFALWEQEPGNGTVNLELARLAARNHEIDDALRFYHGAIYGIWQDKPAQRRREARLELTEFLLAHNHKQQAQAELLGLADDLPRDSALMLRVADRMVQAGDYRRAFQEYREVLALRPDDPEALAGAGEAAYSLQLYPDARNYLRKAVAAHTLDAQAADRLRRVELVLDTDPYQRLGMAERQRRILGAFEQAGSRLQQCASTLGLTLDQPSANDPLPDDYANWKKLRPSIKPGTLRRQPEQGDAAMDLVFRIERDTAKVCGPGNDADQALLLIAMQRGESTP